ncbi:MAG: carboxypeptidase regulatory-like domain-containing protein [Balneolaceae bacterium]|nr:carboxypeptidase regulatory-like domain-containing protein [Balneolaceae bacterium]
MKNKITLLLLAISVITMSVFIGCEEIYEPIIVSGKVVNTESGSPVTDATVSIISPEDLARETFSDSNGEFLFEEVPVDSVIDITIQAQKEGFSTKSITLIAAPEKELIVPDIEISGSEEGGSGPPPSEGSANITLQSKSAETIQVRETGGLETATFEFVVKDSAGVPVDNQNATFVHFEITAGPNGGESIYPDSVKTVDGIAKATLTSGTVPGVVQIRASFLRNGITEKSAPIPITISGGLPNDNHFEVNSEFKNIPANSSNPSEITVLLGDKYGNTVIPGTAVYFGTNKGNIDGSANTDEQGLASAQLRTNNTEPGMATVTVETVDETSSKISRELNVLFSGEPELSVTPTNVDLLGFESETFSVNLSDANGNPLAPGTTLSVSVDNQDLVLVGTTTAELNDTQKTGDGYTEFEFQLRNPDRVTITEDVTLTISTNGPNGSVTKNLRFEIDEEDPGPPGSIYLESITDNQIGVRATGQKEDTQLTFQVVDVNGKNLSNANPVDVEFFFGDRPNGGEFLSPEVVTTNNLGQATVSLTSGEAAGTVQVRARVLDSDISSQPVPIVIHAGLPSQEHFSIVPPQINFPATQFNLDYDFTVLAGDKYSNTVPDDVAIYFETDGGFINGAAYTSNGKAIATLTMGNPIPSDGEVTVRAYTTNDQQNTIDVETDLIFSRQPIITTSTNSIDLSNGDDLTIDFTVEDSNGFPMVEGTTISVTAEGESIELIGQTDVTLRDVDPDFSNIEDLTEFKFNVNDSDSDTNEDAPVIITIEVDGPNGYAKKVIEGRKRKTFN